MKNRNILKSIRNILKKYPVIVLTGPRQSGKTTFLRTAFDSYRYVNLENPDLREYANKDTKGFLNEYSQKVILDEAQQAPKLFSYIQALVDENQKMGQFIISGSQNFQLMEKITQSLAGRAAIFKLFPFDFEEMNDANWLRSDLNKVMTKGFYPALFQRKIDPDRYYADYIETYVKRDVLQLSRIQDQRSFTNFVKLCASRAGSLLNYSDLARDAGVSHSTARDWLSVMETSFIIYFLHPYYKNYSKRLVKSPKLYFYDTGVLCHLLNIRKGRLDPLHPSYGHIFENLIVSEVIKRNAHRVKLRDYYFWRDSHGHEIDLLYPTAKSLVTYEIKSGKTIQDSAFDGLRYFKRIAKDRISRQYLIYGGDEDQNRTHYRVRAWRNTE